MSAELEVLRKKQFEEQQQKERLTHVLSVLEESYQLKNIPFMSPLEGRESLSLTEKFSLVLKNILAVHNIDRSKWGKGNKKTFTEFVDDVQKGERIPHIYNNELIWDVERVRVGVFYHNQDGWWMLNDGKQVYDWPDEDGNPRVRIREIPGLREKIKPKEREKLKEAVLRMLFEESGEELVIADTDRVIFTQHKPANPHSEKRLKVSHTYPGIKSNAILHKGFIIITDDDFAEGKSFTTCQELPNEFNFPGGIIREGFERGTKGFVERQTEGEKEEHKTCYVFWKNLQEDELPEYFHTYITEQALRRSVRNS